MKAKDENLEIVSSLIGPKTFIDSWVELEVQITRPPNDKWFVADTDICLLRQQGSKTNILCKVESSKRTPKHYVVNIRFLAGSKASPNHGETWQFCRVYRRVVFSECESFADQACVVFLQCIGNTGRY